MNYSTPGPYPDPPEPRVDPYPEPTRPATRVIARAMLVGACVGVAVGGFEAGAALIHAEWRDAAAAVLLIALMLWLGQVMWRATQSGVDVLTGENLEKAAAERRALAEALERYDMDFAKARPVAGAARGDDAG